VTDRNKDKRLFLEIRRFPSPSDEGMEEKKMEGV
jgi:hypothetical protein